MVFHLHYFLYPVGLSMTTEIVNNPDSPLAVPQKDLDAFKAQTAKTMLNVTARTVAALDKLSIRLDGIDDAIANNTNLDDMSLQQLIAYFNQCKESFRLRQDFLKVLSGYDVDTSKVKTEEPEETTSTVLSEEDALKIKQELLRRGVSGAVDAEQVEG